MTKLDRLPTDALVVVASSSKALFLGNDGTPVRPRLTVREALAAPDNPPSRDQGSDRPGRQMDRGAAGSFAARSAMEDTDFHALAASAFADTVVAALVALDRAGSVTSLILVAPPEFLGYLRANLPSGLADRVSTEIPKNLTDMPLDRIAATLVEAW